MPITSYHIATCAECGEETPVTEHYWPGTMVDPPDGEILPEECPKCGCPFDGETTYEQDEPPEPDYDPGWDD